MKNPLWSASGPNGERLAASTDNTRRITLGFIVLSPVAEREGFEPPKPFSIHEAKRCPELASYSATNLRSALTERIFASSSARKFYIRSLLACLFGAPQTKLTVCQKGLRYEPFVSSRI